MQEGRDRARPQGARGSGGERPRRVQGRGREGQGRARVLTFELRDARREDAAGIAALVNELSRALYGEDETTVEEISTWFDVPDLVFLVAERPAGLRGYADMTDQALEHTRFWIDLRVPPSEDGDAIARALLEAMEARAARIAAPDATMRVGLQSNYELGVRAAEELGYELFRHSFRMQLDFAGDPEPPRWPAGISVRTFVPGPDDEPVYEAHQDSFADAFEAVRWPYDNWRQWSFTDTFDPSLWFVAEDGGEIAGVCLCRGQAGADGELGWVNVLGVRKPWRRRGLGRALLLHAFGEFRKRGKRGVGLGVDGLNPTGAVALYEQAGMYVERRFDQYKKPLGS